MRQRRIHAGMVVIGVSLSGKGRVQIGNVGLRMGMRSRSLPGKGRIKSGNIRNNVRMSGVGFYAELVVNLCFGVISVVMRVIGSRFAGKCRVDSLNLPVDLGFGVIAVVMRMSGDRQASTSAAV